MTKTVTEIELSELTMVRIRCRKADCGSVIELRVADLVRAEVRCPCCRSDLKSVVSDTANALATLEAAFRLIGQQRDRFTVSFPVERPAE